MKVDKAKQAAIRRRYNIRKKVFGTPERPRLAVFRSNRHIYAQIIDDTAGVTLVSASTRARGLRDEVANGGNRQAAGKTGEALGKRAIQVGIKCVCFDRRGYKYHGRTKALAEAARQVGLVF